MDDTSRFIPPEIWLGVIDWTRMKKDDPYPSIGEDNFDRITLRNLSLVSSSIRGLAQPALFARVSLQIDADFPGLRARLNGYMDLLTNRPESAHWITSFTCKSHLINRAEAHKILALLSSVFLRLPSITTLSFWRFSLTPQMMAHTYSLERLQCVTMIQVNLLPHEEQILQDPTYSSVPPIKTLRIRVTTGGRLHPALAKLTTCSTLHALTIQAEDAVSPMHDILHDYPTIDFTNLSSLTYFNPDPERFEFASRFHNITTLNLPLSAAVHEQKVALSELQQLEHFMGSPPHAMALVPGRPVLKLRLECRDEDDALSTESLTRISLGRVALLELYTGWARWRDGCLADIGRLLPALTHLRLWGIQGSYMSYVLQHIADEFRGMKALRSLHLCGISDGKNKEIPRERIQLVISSLRLASPLLCEVHLGLWEWRLNDEVRWTLTNDLGPI